MTLVSLDDVVIKVSVGIGRSMAEAEAALLVAKARKGEGRCCNIEQYEGFPLFSEEPFESPAVSSYLRLEGKMAKQRDLAALLDLESLKHDPKTGLLNRTGYGVEVSKLRGRGMYNDRVIILIDGDDMKDANSRMGYDETDRYLAAMGLALRDQVRTGVRADVASRGHDILINRKNDGGGDEFVVDLSCDYADAGKIAERYVCAMYSAQVRLNDEEVPV
jgi:GGDEF domain-containing protein